MLLRDACLMLLRVLLHHSCLQVLDFGRRSSLQRLFAQFGNAQRLTAIFDGSTAVAQLCRCPGFKQLTAKRAKTSWDEKRGASGTWRSSFKTCICHEPG